MPAIVEREVKLRFDSPEQARAAVLASGATPLHPRRLQDDALFDTSDHALQLRSSLLRLRRDAGTGRITYKGPTQRAAVKTREERETSVGDADIMQAILEILGFAISFRYQKYREEFQGASVIIAIDETPVGTFVEIEGDERSIAETTALLGRRTSDYILDSYRTLFFKSQRAEGRSSSDMLFGNP